MKCLRVAAVLAVISTPLLADDAPAVAEAEASAVELAPVVVTGEREPAPDDSLRVKKSNVATKIDATVLETPASISTVTEKMLDDRAIRQADKALVFVPGVSYSGSNTGGSTEEFVIRGFSTNRRTFVDGYRNSFRFVPSDLADVSRIDILKGAAGTLYGTAFPGGIVNYTTKKPEAEQRTEVSLSAGRYSYYRGEVDSTGALTADKALQYRVIAAGQSANQSTSGQNNDALGDDRQRLKTSLRWLTPTGGTLDYSFDYYYINQDVSTGIVFTRANGFNYDSDAYISDASYWKHWNRRHVLEVVQPFAGEWQLLVGGLYHDSNWRQSRDSVFGPATILDGGRLNRSTQFNTDQSLIYQLRAEVSGRWQAAPWLELRPIFGAEYVDDAFDFFASNRSITTNNSIDPINPVFGPPPTAPFAPGTKAHNEERAVFAQNLAKVGEKLSVLTGLRYLDYRREVQQGAATAALQPEDSATDYTVSAIYKHRDWFAPFAGYATSTEVQLATLNTGDSAPPRRSAQLEAGVKSELFDGGLLLTLAGYRIDQKDRVENIPGSNPPVGELVGEVRSQGFEFEFSGKLSPQLSVYGGYAYTDAFVSESVLVSNGIAQQGKALVAVPTHQASLYADYRVQRGAHPLLQNLALNAGVIRVIGRQGDNLSRFKLPDYTRVDVGSSTRWGAVSLQLALENLLDERYVSGSSDASFVYQGARRSLTGTVRYAF